MLYFLADLLQDFIGCSEADLGTVMAVSEIRHSGAGSGIDIKVQKIDGGVARVAQACHHLGAST